MYYYLCARCNHITNQKIEMKRHLDKKKKCTVKNINNIFTDDELYNMSLEKNDKLNDKVYDKSIVKK